MDKYNLNKNKLIFIASFFGLNILSSFFLTTNVFLENLNTFPRSTDMIMNSFFGDFGFLFLIFSFSIIIFKTDYARAKFLVIVSIILGVLYFSLSIFFEHYNMFFSFYNLSAFSTNVKGDVLMFIIDSLLILLKKGKFIFLLSGLVIIGLFIILFRKSKKKGKDNSNLIIRYRLIFGLCFFITSILVMALSINIFKLKIKDTWHEDNITSLYGIESVGIFNYYIYEGYHYFNKDTNEVSYDKLASIEQILEEHKNSKNISPLDGLEYEDPKYQGIFKDKNLLLIQMESINNFLIGLEVKIGNSYVEITPNLNKMANKSLYFSNFYTSVGIGNTSDSEFTILSGIYPKGDDFVVYDYNTVKYPTLPRSFKEAGYYTFSSHANTGDFYERKQVHTLLYGFDLHYGQEDLDVTDDNLLHTWLNDEEFLKQGIDIFKEKFQTNKVFAQLITISNHLPYTKPKEAIGDNWFKNKTNIFPSDYKLVDDKMLNDQILGYLEHAAYTDYAIGKALERLAEQGLANDTIIILYGDHGSEINIFELFYQREDILKNDINSLLKYVSDQENRLMQNRMFNANIPLIIYDPADIPLITPKIFSLVRGTSTVARTIANLFALSPDYYFDVDALSDAPTYSYNPKNMDIYLDGIIISGQSLKYYVYDEIYLDYYSKERISSIVKQFQNYKDFNDKLIKYKLFPPLE